jgi:hypothetical protein
LVTWIIVIDEEEEEEAMGGGHFGQERRGDGAP